MHVVDMKQPWQNTSNNAFLLDSVILFSLFPSLLCIVLLFYIDNCSAEC